MSLNDKRGAFEFAGALDVDLVEAVDQNIGNGGILEQRLERAEAENLVENLARQAFALGKAERHDFGVDRIANDDQHFVARRVAGGLAQFFQIEAIENLAMQVGFDLLVIGALEGLKICHGVLNLRLNLDLESASRICILNSIPT